MISDFSCVWTLYLICKYKTNSTPMKSPIFRREKPTGFTLAEVMIALGIAASVMIGLLGAIPHAVKSIRESNSLTVMGRIAQEVIGDIQMSDWDQIEKNFKGKTFQYDSEGLVFEGRVGQQPAFEARVDLPQQAVSLSKKYDFRPDHLRKVDVHVEFIPGGTVSKDNEIRRKNTKEFVFFVANQNKLKVQ